MFFQMSKCHHWFPLCKQIDVSKNPATTSIHEINSDNTLDEEMQKDVHKFLKEIVPPKKNNKVMFPIIGHHFLKPLCQTPVSQNQPVRISSH